MVLYVGIDVGIKNLAFCIIESSQWKKYQRETSNDPGIMAWENVDLIGSQACSAIFKGGKRRGEICGKKAAWQSDGLYYCGTHKAEGCVAYKQAKVTNKAIHTIMKSAFLELDKWDIFNQVAHIVIELQPRINPKMKAFSNGLQAYFILRQQVDNPKPVLRVVKYSRAENKLRVYKGPALKSEKRRSYDQRKDLGIKHTELLLERAPDVLSEHFLNDKKKDDKADAFLHCVWAIDHHKL